MARLNCFSSRPHREPSRPLLPNAKEVSRLAGTETHKDPDCILGRVGIVYQPKPLKEEPDASEWSPPLRHPSPAHQNHGGSGACPSALSSRRGCWDQGVGLCPSGLGQSVLGGRRARLEKPLPRLPGMKWNPLIPEAFAEQGSSPCQGPPLGTPAPSAAPLQGGSPGGVWGRPTVCVRET